MFGNAQDNRTQYPLGLWNACFGVNIGYINYTFSTAQPEPGYNVESVLVPHTAVLIAHYSTGNLFPQNGGVKVPLIFNLGYVLK